MRTPPVSSRRVLFALIVVVEDDEVTKTIFMVVVACTMMQGVWNLGDDPADVVISGLGKVKEVAEPELGTVSETKRLAPNTIRLYCF